MPGLPPEFQSEFDQKGESFYEIAEVLYSDPDRRYTQEELAEKVGRTKPTVSKHTRKMAGSDWLKRKENQTTFAWNSEEYDPASTEGIRAVKSFYVDLWSLLIKHTKTVPGAFALLGFSFIVAAVVVFAFFAGFSLGVGDGSRIPNQAYFAIALGSFLTGVIVTFLSPVQAVVNGLMERIIPEKFL